MAKVVGSAVNVSKGDGGGKQKKKHKQSMADVVELVTTTNKLQLNKKKLVDMVKKSQAMSKQEKS